MLTYREQIALVSTPLTQFFSNFYIAFFLLLSLFHKALHMALNHLPYVSTLCTSTILQSSKPDLTVVLYTCRSGILCSDPHRVNYMQVVHTAIAVVLLYQLKRCQSIRYRSRNIPPAASATTLSRSPAQFRTTMSKLHCSYYEFHQQSRLRKL